MLSHFTGLLQEFQDLGAEIWLEGATALQLGLLVWFGEEDHAVLGAGNGDFGVKVPVGEDFLGSGNLDGADQKS